MKPVCLALEWSSPLLSVGVSMGKEIVTKDISLQRFRMPEALALLDVLFDETGIEPEKLTEVRVGRGPGNYSGVRQAISAALGLAAPGGVNVLAVSSGTLLAKALPEHDEFWVLGDARRGHWWGACFPAEDGPQWDIQPPDVWKQRTGSLPVYSSESERLHGLEAQAMFPHAKDLLRLPVEQVAEPAEPLYLHPPV